MPGLSFMELDGSKNAIPIPEILLVQMAESLSKPEIIALGHELCGRYALRPAADRGQAVTNLPPVSSVSSIVEATRSIKGLHGITALRQALPYMHDNSYSPMETCLSVMAQLPLGEFGYQMGDVTLNSQLEPNPNVSDFVQASFRMPDILFCGTPVGINYDGEGHLNLSEVKSAATALAGSPHDIALVQRLKSAFEEARRNVATDKQRDRDLMTMGYCILPVTKIDLETVEALDRVMGQAMTLIERACGANFSLQKEALADPQLKKGRSRLLENLKKN